MIIHLMQNKLEGIASLTDLGVIRAQGDAAARFLHAQLSQDFLNLTPSQARLAAYCSANGRMLASFVGLQASTDEILLICSSDLLPTTLKRLSMYVLRSALKLSDASLDFALYGLAGEALRNLVPGGLPAWSVTRSGQAYVIGLPPCDQVQRALWVAPLSADKPPGLAISETIWRWGEVQSGIARITAATADRFVPQMLNYESVGGVSFKKGCYPGQEVVARSQFRGTLKRRAYLAHCDSSMQVGDELFQAGDERQACATVVLAAENPRNGPTGCDAIVSMQITAHKAGNLHLHNANGPLVLTSAPPYPLSADS